VGAGFGPVVVAAFPSAIVSGGVLAVAAPAVAAAAMAEQWPAIGIVCCRR